MKSEHRHELETNWLAKHMAEFIDRWGAYGPTIMGAIVVALVVLFGISYLSTSSTAREADAWNTYNEAVSGYVPNMPKLRESAAEYPDSPMQQWADITWADGQLWAAARAFLQNRPAALDALNLAEGTYKSLLNETDDQEFADRAHYGLARIYELRNELDKAREEYLLVKGDFKPLAELRAEELAKPKVKDTYNWLATAEVPRRTAPAGPGTPGRRPEFSEGDLEMPAASTQAAEAAATDVDLFKGLGMPELPAQPEDRYNTGDTQLGTEDATDAATDGESTGQPAGEAGSEP